MEFITIFSPCGHPVSELASRDDQKVPSKTLVDVFQFRRSLYFGQLYRQLSDIGYRLLLVTMSELQHFAGKLSTFWRIFTSINIARWSFQLQRCPFWRIIPNINLALWSFLLQRSTFKVIIPHIKMASWNFWRQRNPFLLQAISF